MSDSYHDNFVGENMEWIPLGQAQEDWSLEGIHRLQLGFFSEGLINPFPDVTPSIYAGMTLYDKNYAATGIVEPKLQNPISVDPPFDKMFRVFINNVYEERIGVWSRELVDLRNEVMIKARAMLYGADPDKEWRRFCGAGMIHFLDYPKIWQPPER